MKSKIIMLICLIFTAIPGWCETAIDISVDQLIEKIEKRYTGSGFSAHFDQKSTIKAMEITDNAYGNLLIKHPGKMRWEYEAPEKQLIITDGKTLWIYRQEDKQVMVGKAAAYFGDGKGASFLSDIKTIRNNFELSIEKSYDADYYRMKLVPKEKKYDIALIYLSVSKKTFDVVKITTYNNYEDETVIALSNFMFDQKPDDSLFNFVVPPGTDTLQLEE